MKTNHVTGRLIEANDRSGVMAEFLYKGSANIQLKNNLIHYNNGFGIESYAAENLKSENNRFAGNGADLKSNEKINTEKYMIMN